MSRWIKRTAEEKAAKKLRRHEHLRQIKGSYVHSDRIHGEFFHPGDALRAQFVAALSGPGVLLVAANPRHVQRIEKLGHRCLWHSERAVPFDDVLSGKVFRKPEVAGPLSDVKFSAKFQGAFVCERLEEQENLHEYLVALRESVALDAPLALVVPNVHHELIEDHLNLFTVGTLVYNLVRAGWDCREAHLFYDKRFVNLLVRRADVPVPWPHKIEALAPYVPFKNVFNFCSSEFPEVYRDGT